MRDAVMQVPPRRAGPALAAARALLGLVLVGVGAAALVGVLLEFLDDELGWLPLILGIIGCAGGSVVFVRASEPWVRRVAVRGSGAGGASRVVVAAGSIVLGIGTTALAAVWIGEMLAVGPFEEACAGFEGILCLFRSQVGGAAAGLMLGIRGAQAILRDRWEIFAVLATAAGVEGIVLGAQRLSF